MDRELDASHKSKIAKLKAKGYSVQVEDLGGEAYGLLVRRELPHQQEEHFDYRFGPDETMHDLLDRVLRERSDG